MVEIYPQLGKRHKDSQNIPSGLESIKNIPQQIRNHQGNSSWVKTINQIPNKLQYYGGLPYGSKAQGQLPWRLWRTIVPHGVNKTPSWVKSTQVPQWVMKEKKKIFSSEPYNIKNFFVGQNHRQYSLVSYFSQVTTHLVHISSENWKCKHRTYTSQNYQETCVNILYELNMQAQDLYQ